MNIGSILSNEFDIELTREEISKLQKESLRSFVKMTTRDGEKIDRWFEIIRGEISERQLYLDMESFPEDADFMDIEQYRIILSYEGYRKLLMDGYVCDRTGLGRIDIKDRNATTRI